MINKVIEYINHPLVKKWYYKHREICNRYPEYPNMNYFGINFKDNSIVSFKVYFHFFHPLTKEEVSNFTNNISEFFEFYAFHKPSKVRDRRNTGVAFSIKFRENKIYKGFHYRLENSKKAYELVGKPKLIPENIFDKDFGPGVNYEFSNDNEVFKKYYYFNKSDALSFFANQFNNVDINKAELLEYTESESFSKLISWRFDNRFKNTKKNNFFSELAQDLINQINEKFELVNLSEAEYKNENIKATYFFYFKDVLNDRPFEDNSAFYLNTLQVFYNLFEIHEDFLLAIKNNFSTIRKEYINALTTLKEFKPINTRPEISDELASWVIESGFYKDDLGYDVRGEEAIVAIPIFNKQKMNLFKLKYFEKTYELLFQVPNLKFVQFILIPPGAHLLPHSHKNVKNSMVFHVNLFDLEGGSAEFIVNGESYFYNKAGDAYLFSPYKEHESKNETKSNRVTLMLEYELDKITKPEFEKSKFNLLSFIKKLF